MEVAEVVVDMVVGTNGIQFPRKSLIFDTGGGGGYGGGDRQQGGYGMCTRLLLIFQT
jgi:hypothetical protein